MMCRIAIASALALVATPVFATSYVLESSYTQGVFRWDHLGFSHPAAQFSMAEGTLEFDQANPTMSSVQVTIPLANVTTGVPDLDEEFRSPAFFDATKFPAATFKSTKVEKGSMPGKLKVIGELSLHGVTKPVTLDVSVVKIGKNPRNSLPTVGFEADTTLKRSDFGLGRFVPQVSDDIQMHITSQAVEAKAYAELQKAEAAQEAAEKAAVKK